MTELVASVRDQVARGCVVSRRRKEGCSVSLQGAPAIRLIIDCDKPGGPLQQNETRCDYLFFGQDSGQADWVVALELKGRAMDASVVIGQLQAGARAAERPVPPDSSVTFRPIVASKGGRKTERRAMREGRVRFRGVSEPVRMVRCGAQLIDGFHN